MSMNVTVPSAFTNSQCDGGRIGNFDSPQSEQHPGPAVQVWANGNELSPLSWPS